jgi:hypothetical protein
MLKSETLEFNTFNFNAMGLIPIKLKLGRLHEKHAAATCTRGNISTFASRRSKTKENHCHDDRPQDLPNAC